MTRHILTAVAVLFAVGLAGCASKVQRAGLLNNQAASAMQENAYDDAEVKLTEALELDPDNPYALVNLGIVYRETNRVEQARETLQKAVEHGANAKLTSGPASGGGTTVADVARSNLQALPPAESESQAKPADAGAGG